MFLPIQRRYAYRLWIGAGNGARTRHLSLGKAALYQMSYSRMLFAATHPKELGAGEET